MRGEEGTTTVHDVKQPGTVGLIPGFGLYVYGRWTDRLAT